MIRPRAAARRNSRGLSLLEVILALTILAIALAILGELVGIGVRTATSARDLARAQLHCESKMAELTTGVVPVIIQNQVELETDPDWLYSVDVQPLGATGLVSVLVTVQQQVETGRRPATFFLTRWIPDPDVPWPTTYEQTTTE